MERRNFLLKAGSAATASTALLAGTQAQAMADTPAQPKSAPWETSLKGPYLDLTTPQGNVTGYARMMANINMTSTKFGWGYGIVQGVLPGEKIRDLVGFQLLSTAKFVPYQGPGKGGYSKVLREIGLYTDLETGEVLEEWTNPYFNEVQPVVPIANDPFNQHISLTKRQAPTYGGLNKSALPEEPFLLDWKRHGDRLHMMRHINLYYPSALQPVKWPRENGKPFNQVTETFIHNISWQDMQNSELTSVEYSGSWNRTTPWLPWMLMGPTPGHCQYNVVMGAVDDINNINPKVLEYVEAKYPKYLVAPGSWEEPSWSSLEWYAAEQRPAPVPSGGDIPMYAPPTPRKRQG